MKGRKVDRALTIVATGLISVALMVFSFGCGRMAPTAPVVQEGYDTEDWETPCNPVSPEDIPATWTELSWIEDEGWFGPTGAVITQVIDCVLLQFRVPPQALDDSVYITVQSAFFARNLQGKVHKKLELVFEPDGVVFSVPATIKFGTALLGAETGDQLILRWFDPQSQSWQVVQTLHVVPGLTLATFEISHFSRYAISCSNLPSSDK